MVFAVFYYVGKNVKRLVAVTYVVNLIVAGVSRGIRERVDVYAFDGFRYCAESYVFTRGVGDISSAYGEFVGFGGEFYSAIISVVFFAVGIADYDDAVFVQRVYGIVIIRDVFRLCRKSVYGFRVGRDGEVGEVVIERSVIVCRQVDFLHGVYLFVDDPKTFTCKAYALRLPEFAQVFFFRRPRDGLYCGDVYVRIGFTVTVESVNTATARIVNIFVVRILAFGNRFDFGFGEDVALGGAVVILDFTVVEEVDVSVGRQ